MNAIQFESKIGEDGIIRLPEGTTIPTGAVVVTVRPVAIAPVEVEDPDSDFMAATRAMLLGIAANSEALMKAGEVADQPNQDEEDMASLRALLLGIAAESEALGVVMPSDMAENHDYYAHGKPRS